MNLEALRKALEASGYNAAPSKLRQGSIHAICFNADGTTREPTEEEYDLIYEDARIKSALTTAEYDRFIKHTGHRRIECKNCDFKLDFNAFTSASLLPRCCANPDQITKNYK